MDKLQYESLYKFLVSLGIILIALPIAALVFLLNGDPILISQTDFEALSEYSQQMIAYRDSITSYFVDIFPWFGAVFICLGVFLLSYGIYKWKAVQKNLDKKLDAETTIQTLSLMEMSNTEVEAKVEAEVTEDVSVETSNESTGANIDTHLSRISKYKEIEDLCYNYFNTRYSKNYSFKRNIRMGKYHYDFIGVSQTDNIDLIVEVKYWRNSPEVSRRLFDVFHRIYDAGISYETIAHRNFKIIVVIITSKEQLPQLERLIESRLQRMGDENYGKIEIKCMAEEAL